MRIDASHRFYASKIQLKLLNDNVEKGTWTKTFARFVYEIEGRQEPRSKRITLKFICELDYAFKRLSKENVCLIECMYK